MTATATTTHAFHVRLADWAQDRTQAEKAALWAQIGKHAKKVAALYGRVA